MNDLDDDLAFDTQLAKMYLRNTTSHLMMSYAAIFFSCLWNPAGIPTLIGIAGSLSVLHRLVFMPRDLRPLANTGWQIVLGIAGALVVLFIGVPVLLTLVFLVLGSLLAIVT